MTAQTGVQIQTTEPSDKIRLRFWPILATVGLAVPSLFLSGVGSKLATRVFGMDRTMEMPWIDRYVGHAGILAGTLLTIAIVGKGRFRTYGVRLPAGRTYAKAALAWGAAFGVIMFIIDYSHSLAWHTAPAGLSLTVTNITGWLTFEALWAGTVEEILFRGLLMTFLMSKVSGQVRLGKYSLHVAGVVIAVLFSLAHLSSFWSRPFLIAAGQQAYAFALAILYAYWYEKSGSVLAPILGHNAGNFLEYVFAFAITWGWR